MDSPVRWRWWNKYTNSGLYEGFKLTLDQNTLDEKQPLLEGSPGSGTVGFNTAMGMLLWLMQRLQLFRR